MAALIIAPLLAIGTYFAVDAFLSETPQSALSGKNYQLVEKPNCRYSSGQCELKNGNFELTLTGEKAKDQNTLVKLHSIHPLDGVKIAYGQSDNSLAPSDMKMTNKNGLEWELELSTDMEEGKRLFIVASANEALYFGDASIAFINYETSYSKDFR